MATALAYPPYIGRYEITGVIGRGGMGVVYKALDPRIGRTVAIKVLTSAFDEGESLARFYREAKYTGSLQHQNIVTLYELGDQDGFPYLVMEYLEGQGLESIISSGAKLSIAAKLNIMAQVCRGLSFAHGRGIVHRDIKPANIVVLSDGTAKIVDFGIAHVGGNRLTRTGMVMGSIFYMSPEQLNGNVELDCRTDIFSAGIVLFQLLTGELPFRGQDTGSTLLKIVNEPPPPLAKYLSSVPPELEPIVDKALLKRREDRYCSCEEFGFELRRLQQQLSREQVSSDLQRASEYIDDGKFEDAKQSLMQVLRLDPDNPAAKQRLAEVQREIEGEQRKHAAVRLRRQAEEALREKRFDAAMSMIDEAMRSEPDETGLREIRQEIQRQQEAAQTYNRALDRAAAAFNAGALAIAKKSMEDAMAVQSLDTRGRMLGQSIAQKLQEQAERERATEEEKQVVISVNTVEKAIADARMFLFFNQRQQARESLVSAMGAALRVPEELRARFEALGRELEREEPSSEELRALAGANISAQPRSELFNATVAFQTRSAPEDQPTGTRAPGIDLKFPQGERPSPPDETIIPEELREFLPPRRRSWPRIVMGAAIVAVVAAGALYLTLAPKPRPPAHNEAAAPTRVASQVTYAEINAEPWGKITSITSRSDQSVTKPNELTPARLPLTSGEYDITVTGPNGEIKKLEINVPPEGGQSYFVVFTKPDIAKIISMPAAVR